MQGTGVGPETTQHFAVGGKLILALWRFQDLDRPGEPGIRHDAPKRRRAEATFAYQLVAIPAGCKRCLGIVEVNTMKGIETQYLIPTPPHAVVIADQVVPGGVEVAGVGTEGHPVANVVRNECPQGSQLLEGAAESGATAGGGFQQYHHRAGNGTKASGVGGCIPGKTRIPAIHVVAGVRHQIMNVVCLAPPKLTDESSLRAGTQEGVGGGEVDKVRIMRHYIAELQAFAFPTERGTRVVRNDRLAPLARRLGKHLNGGRSDRLASNPRPMDTSSTRDIGSQ